MAYGETCRQEAKHQEWLSAGLVLDIVLDGIWNEVSNLEEDLRRHKWLGFSHVFLYLHSQCHDTIRKTCLRCAEKHSS